MTYNFSSSVLYIHFSTFRSNSEERPQAPEGGRRRDESSIRRVSSHEDFTLAKNQHNISNHHHSHVSHRHHGTSLGPSATGHRSSKTKNFLAELIDHANVSTLIIFSLS